ncbi:Hypothetical predicted protein [Paramuricea clavata]|uniref:Uncharacterized protein n=1 Tax=Paramuricea clavata TaxID=317549 RepID=A0A6S7J6A9_PARCT|nr:Hypothetical predicted protein [Paramuricea clavata]
MYGSSSTTPNVTRSLNEGQSTASSNQPPVGWLETISQRFQTTDVSEETREILLAAWRRNTTNAYASAWNKCVGWCGEREINPFSVSLNTVLEFLKDQFKDGKAYRTTLDRSSDLAKKDLRFRIYHPEGVFFKLPGLSKTSKPGDSPKSSFHASFGEDKDLCPVNCLKCYEDNTNSCHT